MLLILDLFTNKHKNYNIKPISHYINIKLNYYCFFKNNLIYSIDEMFSFHLN